MEGSSSSDAWSAAKYVWNAAKGSDEDAGLFSQFKAKSSGIDQNAFVDPDLEKNKALTEGMLAGAQGRVAPTSTAATLGPAQGFEGATATGATLDTSKEAEARAQQAALMARLNDMALGKGPSLAENQLKYGLDQSLQQQGALAAMGRGRGNPALAMRALGNQAATMNAQTNQAAANARLAEQLAANQQLAAVSSGMRGQDQSTAALQAKLQQDAALANAGFKQQAGLFSAQEANEFAKARAGFQQQSSLANMQAQLQQTGLNDAQARAALAARLGLSESQLAAQMAYEQMKTNQELGVAGINAGSYNAAADRYAKIISSIGQGAAAASDERGKTDTSDGGDDVRKFLDYYSANGYASSPGEAKYDIGAGGGKIRAFLDSLRGGGPPPQMAMGQYQPSGENPWDRIGAGAAAGNAKAVEKDKAAIQSSLDAKAKSADTAMLQGKLQDMGNSKGGAEFDPSKYSGNFGLDASGYKMPAGGNAPPQEFTKDPDVVLAKPQPYAVVGEYTAPHAAPSGWFQQSNAELDAMGKQMVAPAPAAGPSPFYTQSNAELDAMGAKMGLPGYGSPVVEIAPQYITASDERDKTDVQAAGMKGFLDHIDAHEYRYKDPSAPGAGEGKHFSPMAQEFLAAGPVGKSMVVDGPEGLMVDYGKAGGVTFAALADLHDRLKAVEAKSPKKRGKGA